jgi:hypothetical protein
MTDKEFANCSAVPQIVPGLNMILMMSFIRVPSAAITTAAAILILWTRMNPLWILTTGGALGALRLL